MQTVDLDIPTLIEGCLANNRRAQEGLYRQFYGFAMTIALRYSRDEADAADIMSHAFVKIFKSLHTYDATKGSLHAWIKRIVVNEGLDHIKARGRFSENVEVVTVAEPEINGNVLDDMGAEEIMKLIQKLPPATHAVFVLYAVEGCNHREIAEKLGISEGTSKWHLSEARKTLQKQLAQFKYRMNQKTTYELKIGDKLQELPLPDLQDAIWSRIERTLDIDMPTDDGGGDGGPDTPSPFGGGATGVGSFMFSLFFVAAVTAFIVFKSTDKTPQQGPAPDNSPAFELRAPSNTSQQPPPGATAGPRNNNPVRTADPGPTAGDSALGQPLVVTPPISVDTTTGNSPTALVQQPPVTNTQTPVDTTGVKKRPRGVPVNPADYRIVPKKDSTRQ